MIWMGEVPRSLGDVLRAGYWLDVRCRDTRCGNHRLLPPTEIAKLATKEGPGMQLRELERRSRCTTCKRKGARVKPMPPGRG